MALASAWLIEKLSASERANTWLLSVALMTVAVLITWLSSVFWITVVSAAEDRFISAGTTKVLFGPFCTSVNEVLVLPGVAGAGAAEAVAAPAVGAGTGGVELPAAAAGVEMPVPLLPAGIDGTALPARAADEPGEPAVVVLCAIPVAGLDWVLALPADVEPGDEAAVLTTEAGTETCGGPDGAADAEAEPAGLPLAEVAGKSTAAAEVDAPVAGLPPAITSGEPFGLTLTVAGRAEASRSFTRLEIASVVGRTKWVTAASLPLM